MLSVACFMINNYVDNIGLHEWWCQFIYGLNKLYYCWICALYLYGKFLFKSLIFIANETSILPQVVNQVKIPPTSIQYCFIIMLFVVFLSLWRHWFVICINLDFNLLICDWMLFKFFWSMRKKLER